jgi:hypothetical protein
VSRQRKLPLFKEFDAGRGATTSELADILAGIGLFDPGGQGAWPMIRNARALGSAGDVGPRLASLWDYLNNGCDGVVAVDQIGDPGDPPTRGFYDECLKGFGG